MRPPWGHALRSVPEKRRPTFSLASAQPGPCPPTPSPIRRKPNPSYKGKHSQWLQWVPYAGSQDRDMCLLVSACSEPPEACSEDARERKSAGIINMKSTMGRGGPLHSAGARLTSPGRKSPSLSPPSHSKIGAQTRATREPLVTNTQKSYVNARNPVDAMSCNARWFAAPRN